jgi:hypothetical protein
MEQLFGSSVRMEGQPDLVLHFALVEGRPECVGIEIGARARPTPDDVNQPRWRTQPGVALEGPAVPLTSTSLRDINLGRLVMEARRSKWSANIRAFERKRPSSNPSPDLDRELREWLGKRIETGEIRRTRSGSYKREDVQWALREWKRSHQKVGRTTRKMRSGRYKTEVGQGGPDRWQRHSPQELNRLVGEWLRRFQQMEESGRKRGRPRIYDIDHFREVAQVYSEAEWFDQHPTKAVAHRWTVGRSTAAKWVSRARHEFDLLPATEKGQARGTRGRRAG